MTDDQRTTDPVVTEIRGLRGDVQGLTTTVADERRGRRLSMRLAVVAVVALGAGGGYGVVSWTREGRITCETRTRSRAETRAAIGVAVDEGARALGADDRQRVEIRQRVDTAVLRAYPPPDC